MINPKTLALISVVLVGLVGCKKDEAKAPVDAKTTDKVKAPIAKKTGRRQKKTPKKKKSGDDRIIAAETKDFKLSFKNKTIDKSWAKDDLSKVQVYCIFQNTWQVTWELPDKSQVVFGFKAKEAGTWKYSKENSENRKFVNPVRISLKPESSAGYFTRLRDATITIDKLPATSKAVDGKYPLKGTFDVTLFDINDKKRKDVKVSMQFEHLLARVPCQK